jgi:hypothetical protein
MPSANPSRGALKLATDESASARACETQPNRGNLTGDIAVLLNEKNPHAKDDGN